MQTVQTLVSDESLVQDIFDQLRPYIEADGGGIELVKIHNGTVYIKMLGACTSCPASTFTQKMVIEKRLKEKIPSITDVVVVD